MQLQASEPVTCGIITQIAHVAMLLIILIVYDVIIKLYFAAYSFKAVDPHSHAWVLSLRSQQPAFHLAQLDHAPPEYVITCHALLLSLLTKQINYYCFPIG